MSRHLSLWGVTAGTTTAVAEKYPVIVIKRADPSFSNTKRTTPLNANQNPTHVPVHKSSQFPPNPLEILNTAAHGAPWDFGGDTRHE